MNASSIFQYAAFLTLFPAVAGLIITVLNHRQQVATQIFLAVTARHDDLLAASPAAFWASSHPENSLPEPSDDLTLAVFRYYHHVSVIYFLRSSNRIPSKLWGLILPAVERVLATPLYMREWRTLEPHFVYFPEFVTFVAGIHRHHRGLQ